MGVAGGKLKEVIWYRKRAEEGYFERHGKLGGGGKRERRGKGGRGLEVERGA